MATFTSRAYDGGIKFRPLEEGRYSISSTVKIPAGRTFTSGDVIKFLKLGANVEIYEAFLSVDKLEDSSGTNSSLHLGTFAGSGAFDVDGILASSVITRAGGNVSVTNGGDDPFTAPNTATPTTQTVDVQATILGTFTQTVQGALDRYITLTLVCGPETTGVTEDVPYVYADRYDDAGESGGLVS